MGYALAAGCARADLGPIYAADPSETARARLEEIGARVFEGVLEAAREADDAAVVVIAVKPQQADDVLPRLASVLRGRLVVSIMAGMTTARIESALGGKARVVRAMPNLPVRVGAGVTAIAPGARASEGDLAEARRIFASVGDVLCVDEKDMDAVTALSGSGPAYYFHLTETLASAGEDLGLAPEVARRLAVGTAAGAGKLLAESGESPGTLRERVTSPGGTTAAALDVLRKEGVAEAYGRALRAARDRSRELSK